MKLSKAGVLVDAVLEQADKMEVEILGSAHGQMTLYVHVNGQTVLRIGQIKKEQIVTLPHAPSYLSA